MSRIRTAALTVGAVLLASVATAATPQDTIKARQANFKAMGKAMKTIGDEARKPAPALAAVRAGSANLVRLSAQLPSWFPRGSGPETGVKTQALPAIWSKPAEFQKAAVDFNRAARALNAAAAGTDAAAITAAMRATGATCKACHDQFRSKDD